MTDADAIKALEDFVVHNEALHDLETRIGRFNIFDALRATRDELKHSNFLAWLLDPAESHGQGPLFLKVVLWTCCRGRGRRALPYPSRRSRSTRPSCTA